MAGAPPGSAVSRRDATSPTAIIATLAISGITVGFAQSMLFPILPLLPQLLNAAPADAAWTVTVTLLFGVVATPVMGRLGDMYGKRRLILLGIGLLILGSVVCGMSDSIGPMIFGRALQGPAVGVIPLAVSIMRDLLPAEKTPLGLAVMIGSGGLGGAVGLPAAAFIADNFDWHVLFWTTAALGLTGALAIIRLVPESKERPGGHFDLIGAAGLATGLTTLLLVVSKGTGWGWSSGRTLALLAVTTVVLLCWVRWQLRIPEPLVDIRSTARPQVLFTNLATLSLGFALFTTNLALPQLLQAPTATGYGLGQSLLVTGLVLAPQGLMIMLAAPLSARITKRSGPRTTLILGSTLTGAGYLLSTVMMSDIWQLVVASCIVATGFGCALGAIPALIIRGVPVSETAAANALNALMRAIGTAISSAVAGVFIAQMTIDLNGLAVPSQNALRFILALGAVAAFISVAFAWLIPATPRPASENPRKETLTK